MGRRAADARRWRRRRGGAAPASTSTCRSACTAAPTTSGATATSSPQEPSAGAPPDALFTKGQNWGFPPLQPERLRERGYDYLIDCLRHHLEHAGLLRIDHVMQLHRLFWIPRGMDAADGVYVRYPAEELYAVLSLECHRHQAMIVGENLGTVPPEVYEAMDRHEVHGMYVVQYELQPGSQGLREPPAKTVASLNTHDMPTFRPSGRARTWTTCESLGFFDARAGARGEGAARDPSARRMEEALPPDERRRGADDRRQPSCASRLEHLAASPARMVLVNLEDLWRETEPQNVPGTHRAAQLAAQGAAHPRGVLDAAPTWWSR